MIIYVLLILLVSALVSRALLRRITYYSLKKRILSTISDRNKRQAMRLGGLAFFPAMIIAILAVGSCYFLCSGFEATDGEYLLSSSVVALIFAALICFLTGVWDDISDIGYRQKLLSQFTCAFLLVVWGARIDNLYGLLGLYEIHPLLGTVLSIVVVMLIINAINLIDGIDGLCAGISSIALLYYGSIFLLWNDSIHAWIAFAMLGAVIPFIAFNIWGIRHKIIIFMGDTGSTSLGLLLAFLCLSLYAIVPDAGSATTRNPLTIVIAPLIVPVFDVIRVFIHRLKSHKNPFKADLNHIHHKLLAIGLSQHQSLLVLLSISIFYTATNILLSSKNINLIVGLDILIYTVLNIGLNWKKNKN